MRRSLRWRVQAWYAAVLLAVVGGFAGFLYQRVRESKFQEIDARLVGAFRRGMLLHGVDLPGLGGMTTAAHKEADVEQAVAAVEGTLELLREEGLV